MRLWDSSTGQPIGAPLTGHTGMVYAVAFSPDGKRIVSGSFDKTVRLWDTGTGQPIGPPLTGHTEMVYAVAFSPDGKRIVSGSDDKTVRLWDADTGQPIGAPLIGHTQGVTSVAFSPDGKRIVSGSDDKTVRLWDSSTGQPIGAPSRCLRTAWRLRCGVRPGASITAWAARHVDSSTNVGQVARGDDLPVVIAQTGVAGLTQKLAHQRRRPHAAFECVGAGVVEHAAHVVEAGAGQDRRVRLLHQGCGARVGLAGICQVAERACPMRQPPLGLLAGGA